MCNNNNDNKYVKKILILLYGIVIISLFCLFFIEVLGNVPFDFASDNPTAEIMLSAITFQLGTLTAWLFNNNNKKK